MYIFQIEMQCERLARLPAFLQALAEHKAKDIGKLSVSVVPSRKFLMGTLDCWPPKVKSIPLVHSWTEKWLQLWTLPLAVIFNMVGKNSPYCPIKDLQKKISNGLLMKWCSQSVYFLGPLGRDKWDARLTESWRGYACMQVMPLQKLRPSSFFGGDNASRSNLIQAFLTLVVIIITGNW